MPGSTVMHAAVFTAGALLGGGIAAVVSCRKNQQQLALPSRPEPHQSVALTEHHSSPVLKYGHPGEFGAALLTKTYNDGLWYRSHIGPDT